MSPREITPANCGKLSVLKAKRKKGQRFYEGWRGRKFCHKVRGIHLCSMCAAFRLAGMKAQLRQFFNLYPESVFRVSTRSEIEEKSFKNRIKNRNKKLRKREDPLIKFRRYPQAFDTCVFLISQSLEPCRLINIDDLDILTLARAPRGNNPSASPGLLKQRATPKKETYEDSITLTFDGKHDGKFSEIVQLAGGRAFEKVRFEDPKVIIRECIEQGLDPEITDENGQWQDYADDVRMNELSKMMND